MSEYEHDTAPPSVPDLASAGRLTNEEQSLWENLAEQREEIAEQRETLIQIPGYKGVDVYARYKLLTGDDLERISRKSLSKKGAKISTWDRNLTAALDTMAAACSGIFYQLAGMDEPQPITVGGTPVANFGDPKLQEGLKIHPEVKTTRGVILSMFGNNDLAVSAHAVKLNRWFSDTNRDVDDEFLGEGL